MYHGAHKGRTAPKVDSQCKYSGAQQLVVVQRGRLAWVIEIDFSEGRGGLFMFDCRLQLGR